MRPGGAVRKGSGVWVCTASRKEKACSVYKKNKVERGCVVATVVARAAPGGAWQGRARAVGFGCVQRLERTTIPFSSFRTMILTALKIVSM